MGDAELSATFLGHSTVSLRMDGTTVLTDPVLSRSVAAIVRRVGPEIAAETLDHPEVVVVSHAHYDHLDVPTLRRLRSGYTVVVPRGVGRYVRAVGAGTVIELAAGESTTCEGVEIVAVYADHDGRRHKLAPEADAVGYLIRSDSTTVYHAGDTALFAAMADLSSEPVDLALMPVWGWGPRLGPGHLDPEQAAEATALIEPRWAIPVHWGALWSKVVPRDHHRRTAPPVEYVDAVRRTAPKTQVAMLAVGETWTLPDSSTS
jgi:L-ascorbate metabolism protein UlaG (beta-lactamase superfamily)